jgi:lincosamide and streptogramin A transport system ATP-binding/permease protein
LRKLDFSRDQFEKDMVTFSGGQKKKVLIAKSLCEQVHLHVWDEPLNFIDVISRMQIEELLLEYQPTLLFVEHDREFCKNIATKMVEL